MRIYLLLVLVICVGALSTMAQKTKKSKTKRLKIKGNTTRQNKPVAILPSSEVKVAEELVDIAQRLLRMLKSGTGSANVVTHLCPNGKPEAVCQAEPCSMVQCSNIFDAVCENQCHTCEPLFKVGQTDVTGVCKRKFAGAAAAAPAVTNMVPANAVPDPGLTVGPVQAAAPAPAQAPAADPFQIFPFHPFQMLPPPATEAQQEGAMNALARMLRPFEGASRAKSNTGKDAANTANTKNQRGLAHTANTKNQRGLANTANTKNQRGLANTADTKNQRGLANAANTNINHRGLANTANTNKNQRGSKRSKRRRSSRRRRNKNKP